MKRFTSLVLFLLLSLLSFQVNAESNENLEKIQKVDFNPSLMESIENGRKTATVRAGHRAHLVPGPALAKSNDGRVIDIEIERVFLTGYTWSEEAITSEILRRENMKDTTEAGFIQLYEALKVYYPSLQYGDPATVIFFHLKEK